jgi:hypothetical protein
LDLELEFYLTTKKQHIWQLTAADVNKLRTMTGAGMMDCKH